MKASFVITAAACALTLVGCANREGVSPSKNPTLQAVSPSSTAAAEPGVMQRSLDAWLKEEWTPMTQSAPVTTTSTASDGTVTTVTKDSKQVVTTTKTPDGQVTTTTAPAEPEPEDTTPFTLQKYADKWKVYHDNKAKMNEGKPKEPSHTEMMNTLPVVGK
ncbi:MAG: hypothetical protein ACOZBX_01345 [Campylobacterota bacterium]